MNLHFSSAIFTFRILLSDMTKGDKQKQVLAQEYTQRIEGANISGLKLSRSPSFENFNYNNALLNYNNGPRLGVGGGGVR